ncbi:EF-P lysine aminoacylase EpmA [Pelobacter seleniigenes]|uniref:EF-P lysine aminoacylase EpmA n=1 Tax=Pelobacter seleniigenes TaxID=407188 RepID=UPI0004A6AC43|nr:EF-P lysine aminoacylase EpmA [Pelobacter seleniigenes]
MEPNWQLARKRAFLFKRARILQQVRAFFMERDFLDVETPQRIPANAPELHIDAEPAAEWFLQTSPELCMKRLLAAGYERIFQICHCWRQGERSRRHLPEYSMLEWYRQGCDYTALMDDCEALLDTLCPAGQLAWQGQLVDLQPPWPRLTVAEAFAAFSPMPLAEALASGEFDTMMALEIEPQLPTEKPLFLIEYPAACASLARTKPGQPAVAERFELYIAGLELANAFSELTDSQEQRQRFAAEEQQRRACGKPPYPTPQPFLKELDTLSAAAGIALGIDRLVMLLCDLPTIDDCVAFTPEQL